VERITAIPELRARLAAARRLGDRIGLVPTMGALHAGHLALVRLAARHADTVVVTVFVNPTQFDRADDLAAYPRDLAGDEAALVDLGDQAPAVLFAPERSDLYPRELLTTVHVAGLTDHLCGATRPGHFDGVATIVTKLFHLVQPDVAVFGRKDAQQLQVIRRLVADLDVPVELVAGPTVREPDGIALSSRNRRLAPAERVAARSLPRALGAAVELARAGRRSGAHVTAGELRSVAAGQLATGGAFELDYLEVVDPDTLMPQDPGAVASARSLVAVAAFVGPVRLIDNVDLGDLDDEERLLSAVHGSADTDVVGASDDLDAPGFREV
jgi:pantoate--beta-alanine ligase